MVLLYIFLTLLRRYKMANIYELTADLLQLQEMLEDAIDDDEIILDTMEAVTGDYDVKMEAYAKVIKNLEGNKKMLSDEAKRLSGKAKIIDNNIVRLKKIMFDSMKKLNKTTSGGNLFKVSIQKNGGVLPIIVDVATSKLPDEYVKIEESPDLDAIRKALEDHADNIIKSMAHFGERGESLRIK